MYCPLLEESISVIHIRYRMILYFFLKNVCVICPAVHLHWLVHGNNQFSTLCLLPCTYGIRRSYNAVGGNQLNDGP